MIRPSKCGPEMNDLQRSQQIVNNNIWEPAKSNFEPLLSTNITFQEVDKAVCMCSWRSPLKEVAD